MPRLVYLVSALFLLLVTGTAAGIVPRLVITQWPGDSRIEQGLNLLMIVVSIWLFRRGFRGARSIGIGAVLALAAPALLLISAAWSFDPQATVRRGVEYMFVALGAIGVVGCLEGDEFMELVFMACGISAFASIVLREVHPEEALQEFVAMRGIFPHKNVLGQVMAAGVLACLHVLQTSRRGRLRKVGALTVFVVLALASKSATGFVTSFIYCGLQGLITMFRTGGIVRLIGLALLILVTPVVLMVLVFPDAFFEMIGKDPTLSGRTEMWAYVIAAIEQRPLLGWGYWGFWSPDNPVAAEISVVVQWAVPEAHNALLEILLNVGVLGAAFFVFLIVRNIWFALRCLRTPAAGLGVTALLCYIGILFMGVSEAVMMDPFQPTTILFFGTGLMCERAVRVSQRRRYLAPRPGLPVGRPNTSPMPTTTGT
jgi:exopolysaccharide production protein ExoQ